MLVFLIWSASFANEMDSIIRINDNRPILTCNLIECRSN